MMYNKYDPSNYAKKSLNRPNNPPSKSKYILLTTFIIVFIVVGGLIILNPEINEESIEIDVAKELSPKVKNLTKKIENIDEVIQLYNNNDSINITNLTLSDKETKLIKEINNLTLLTELHNYYGVTGDPINFYIAWQHYCINDTEELIKEIKKESKDANYTKDIEKDQKEVCSNLEGLAKRYIKKYEKDKK